MTIDTDPTALDFLAKCGEVQHDAALKLRIAQRDARYWDRCLDADGLAHIRSEVARAGMELRAAIRAAVRTMDGVDADNTAHAVDMAVVMGSRVFTDPTYPRLK